MKITKIIFPHFEEIIVVGEMNRSDKSEVKTILDTMSMDEYAGYSPTEQKKYTEIMNITNRYTKPFIQIIA